MKRLLLSALLLLAAPALADAQSAGALDAPFRDFCSAHRANPVCGREAPGDAYKWLLLADACDHAGTAAYCTAFAAIRQRTEPCVVAYSHRLGRWRARHRLARQPWAFDTDVNGVPVITVSRSDACTAIVEDTNPLVYGVQLGSVDEQDTALAGGLKDLAALLGEAIQTTAPLLLERGALPKPFGDLARTTSELASSLLPLSDLEGEAIAALNAAERSDDGAVTAVDWTRTSLDAGEWHRRFDQLRTRRREASDSLGGQPPDNDERTTLEQAQKVLDRQAEVAEVAASLASVRDRWNRFVAGTRALTWMPVDLRPLPVRWTKDQVHAFKVSVDTPFASDVSTRLPKVDTAVRFTSPNASMFGVGAGLIVTPIRQVTYKAVAAEAGVKRIAATERDGRTGQLALFLDWRVVQAWHPAASRWRARPAVAGGVALDTKTPGFFAGASIEVTRWFRVSAGRTWQSVRVLDGQQEQNIVESTDAIRLHDRFEGARYFSVSFALDGLGIFKTR